ncbi:Cro/C1-type HTH DNA-binding domain-containing protein [Hydrobacter penzbergensis]|uniref:Cro/C1-type HTH DNA-binding domain-containing protein n=1 Tax=Hydrobacter penzbergensis TaxID=1235997 RepID=A0A8X8IKW0_9BACT|nr:helix-turn-helix transcriptional regulator [Hydrobacter penzbergensis]SDX68804.1 Cro/C1-type HTH DNA-binding domain-containing protein [Hydrobacter penzbergensis]
MTKLGLYLAQKSVNKAEVARKTGLTKARMNELTLNERSHLRAEELYRIALAIDVNPCELLTTLYGDLVSKK